MSLEFVFSRKDVLKPVRNFFQEKDMEIYAKIEKFKNNFVTKLSLRKYENENVHNKNRPGINCWLESWPGQG
jgi:elongation factor P--beta-lysine ligase